MQIRKYTNKILDYVDEGIIDRNQLIQSLLTYMSESDVQDFYEHEYAFDYEDSDEEN